MKSLIIALAGLACVAGNAFAQDRSFSVQMVPGKPIETRPPELKTDKPAFPGQTRAPYKASVAVTATLITDQLKQPWALAFLPNGSMLVTEKPGTMRIVDAKGAISSPIAGAPAVHFVGQVGLLDVILDPAYATNNRIFFSFSEPVQDDRAGIVIASAKLDEAGKKLTDVKVIFRTNPALSNQGNRANQGGRLLIGKDGFLYSPIGDRSTSPPWDRAQKLDTHLGKIIRITLDGAPAPGNPFLNTPGALPEIYSLGHRSEEGIALDLKGRVWETEHGARGGDELNLIEPGKNYGWPVITHGIDYPGSEINGGLTEKEGLVQPRYYWDPVIAPSGMAFYDGKLFPTWKGDVLIGALRGTMLVRLKLKNDKVVEEEALLYDMKNRIRDVRVGPDGAVYLLSDDGKLLKVTPK
jgi:glucose/arabinose dehydrogenase